MDVVYGEPDMTGFVLLNTDPVTGIRTLFKTNPDGTTTVCHQQDVERVFESNARLYSESEGRKMGEWELMARIPNTLIDGLGISEAIEQKDRKFLGKVLNDTDNRKYRTHKARI
jgi:hypothetical protein